MNRLAKKCVIASAGLHLLLFVILLVGPAFLSEKNAVNDMPVLDVIPSKLVDDLMSGGGNPNAQPPPPAPLPEPVKPQPKPEKVVKAEPPQKEPPKIANLNPSPTISRLPSRCPRLTPRW